MSDQAARTAVILSGGGAYGAYEIGVIFSDTPLRRLIADTVDIDALRRSPTKLTRPYRKLTIHRYRPASDLGGAVGMLDFNREKIEELIARGYHDAAGHDCSASGCSLGE